MTSSNVGRLPQKRREILRYLTDKFRFLKKFCAKRLSEVEILKMGYCCVETKEKRVSSLCKWDLKFHELLNELRNKRMRLRNRLFQDTLGRR